MSQAGALLHRGEGAGGEGVPGLQPGPAPEETDTDWTGSLPGLSPGKPGLRCAARGGR